MQAMSGLPDGIVTVHMYGRRYRGAYHFQDDQLVVTAYGLGKSSANMAALGNEREGKAALNLAKLVLIEMVKDAIEVRNTDAGLSLQGSTTQRSY